MTNKLSEVIARLQELQTLHGDVEIWHISQGGVYDKVDIIDFLPCWQLHSRAQEIPVVMIL